MPRQSGPRLSGPPSAVRWVVLAIGSLAVLAGVYYAAVRTYTGQRVENDALTGSKQVNPDEVTAADEWLATFTLASLAIAVTVLAVIGWVRGGVRLAAVGVVLAAIASTEVLKRVVLPRPVLVEAPEYLQHNSFPSGHTTVAMSVACATLLVVSWRWRTVAMLVVTTWTVGVGAYTVIARWHRLSDTLGADAIALLMSSIAGVLLVRAGMVRRVPRSEHAPLRTLLVVLGSVYVLVVGGLGVYVGWAGITWESGVVDDFNVYLAAQSLASVGSVLTILIAWWSWHRLETA